MVRLGAAAQASGGASGATVARSPRVTRSESAYPTTTRSCTHFCTYFPGLTRAGACLLARGRAPASMPEEGPLPRPGGGYCREDGGPSTRALKEPSVPSTSRLCCTKLARPHVSTALARALATLLLASPVAAQAITAWVVSSTEKVRPSAAAAPLAAAELAAARNEFEAFQIAVAGPLAASPPPPPTFTGPTELAAPRLFREAITTSPTPAAPTAPPVRFPTRSSPMSTTSSARSGTPFRSASPPAKRAHCGSRRSCRPARRPVATRRRSRCAPPDRPTSPSRSRSPSGTSPSPSTSSLKSHFGLYYGDLPTAHGVSGDAFSALRARYAQLGLDHRISLSNIDDGNGDLNHYATFYGAALRRPRTHAAAGRAPHLGPVRRPRHHRRTRAVGRLLQGQGLVRPPLRLHLRRAGQLALHLERSPSRAALVKAADPEFRSLTTTITGRHRRAPRGRSTSSYPS